MQRMPLVGTTLSLLLIVSAKRETRASCGHTPVAFVNPVADPALRAGMANR